MKQGRGIESACVVEEGEWNDSEIGQALWYKWQKKKNFDRVKSSQIWLVFIVQLSWLSILLILWLKEQDLFLWK